MALASGETNQAAPRLPPDRWRVTWRCFLCGMPKREVRCLHRLLIMRDFLKTKSELLGMDVALLTEPEVADGKASKFSPWGWDPALRKWLDDIGGRSDGAACGLYEYSERASASSAGGKVVAWVAVE